MTGKLATDTESNMLKGIEKGLKQQDLVKHENLVERFGDFGDEIAKYEKYSMNIKVADTGSLAVAESHSSTINKILKDIEDVRKIFKEPYFKAGKTIDEYAKTLADPFERAKKRINSAITAYKEVQEAAKRIEEEKLKEAAEKERLEKENELAFLKRIKDQAYARLYGGRFTTSSGEQKSTAGCVDAKQCDEFTLFIKNKFPKPSTFKHVSAEVDKLFELVLKLAAEHKANLSDLESNNEVIRRDALERITLAKTKAEIIAEDKLANAEAAINKEFAKDVRSIEKETKEAGKGLRMSILFKVVNEDDVPIDFKTVNETLVREYIQQNKEKVLELLKENKQPIKGLHVYVEKNYVSGR